MLNTLIQTISTYLPALIMILVPILIILFIIWLILKLAKSSISVFGKLLKWGVIIFVAVIIFWSFVNVLGGVVGA
ncbi:hypothetical protein H7Y21_02910 [Arenimonas sp.]|nr:hypothetical protein [Candidatus Parcubacteria bacterium]